MKLVIYLILGLIYGSMLGVCLAATPLEGFWAAVVQVVGAMFIGFIAVPSTAKLFEGVFE